MDRILARLAGPRAARPGGCICWLTASVERTSTGAPVTAAPAHLTDAAQQLASPAKVEGKSSDLGRQVRDRSIDPR